MASPVQVQASQRSYTRAQLRAPASLPLIAVIASALGGCAAQGAPSFALFGAYFPDWILVALIGIFVAAATRSVMVATGLDEILPFQLLTCTSIGVTSAILAWLIWFAQ